jgi:hypothetical protein
MNMLEILNFKTKLKLATKRKMIFKIYKKKKQVGKKLLNFQKMFQSQRLNKITSNRKNNNKSKDKETLQMMI